MEQFGPSLGALVWHLSTRWRTEADRIVAPYGLTHAQYLALATLFTLTERGEKPRQRALATATGLTPLFVSKLIRALELSGQVTRRPDPDDSRAVLLDLTASGRDTIKDARAAMQVLERDLTAPLGDQGGLVAREFGGMLRRLLDHHQTLGGR